MTGTTVGSGSWSRVLGAGVVVWTTALLMAGPASAQDAPPPQSSDESPATNTQQVEQRSHVQGGIGILGAVPLGVFKDNIGSAGGFSGHLAAGLGDSPVTLGGELAYLWYGEETRTVPFSLTIPDVLVDVTTNNAIFLAHARLRVQQRSGRWRPYVDALFGLTDLVTDTSIDLGSACNVAGCGSVSPSTTNLRDVVLSYGGGVGIWYGFGSRPSAARLDISVRYLRSGEADYLRQGAIRRELGEVFLDPSRSRTDMVLIFIGVSGGR